MPLAIGASGVIKPYVKYNSKADKRRSVLPTKSRMKRAMLSTRS